MAAPPGSEQLRIALTGATGALGGALLHELCARGHTVRALHRPRPGRTPPELPGVEWLPGDLDDPSALDRLVAGTDAILHAAYCGMEGTPAPGRSVGEHFIETDVAGTLRLIERCPATRRNKLVFVSSLAVYGPSPSTLPGSDRLPLDEDFPVWPREFYGAHKAALEKMVIAASGDPGMDTSAFRLGCMLGVYPDPVRDPLGQTVREASEFGEIRTQKGAYVIADRDAARILVDALDDPRTRGGVFNTFHRWLDFADLSGPLTALLGREVRVTCAPAPEPDPPLRRDRLDRLAPQWTTEQRLAELLLVP